MTDSEKIEMCECTQKMIHIPFETKEFKQNNNSVYGILCMECSKPVDILSKTILETLKILHETHQVFTSKNKGIYMDKILSKELTNWNITDSSLQSIATQLKNYQEQELLELINKIKDEYI